MASLPSLSSLHKWGEYFLLSVLLVSSSPRSSPPTYLYTLNRKYFLVVYQKGRENIFETNQPQPDSAQVLCRITDFGWLLEEDSSNVLYEKLLHFR